MAVNKVVYGTTVLVDLTEDTVTPQTLLLGNRAHGRDGQIVEGTLSFVSLPSREMRSPVLNQ